MKSHSVSKRTIGLRHSKRYSKIKELNHLHNMFLILLYSLPCHLGNWLVLPFSGLFNINYLVSNGVFKLMYIVLFVPDIRHTVTSIYKDGY